MIITAEALHKDECRRMSAILSDLYLDALKDEYEYRVSAFSHIDTTESFRDALAREILRNNDIRCFLMEGDSDSLNSFNPYRMLIRCIAGGTGKHGMKALHSICQEYVIVDWPKCVHDMFDRVLAKKMAKITIDTRGWL